MRMVSTGKSENKVSTNPAGNTPQVVPSAPKEQPKDNTTPENKPTDEPQVKNPVNSEEGQKEKTEEENNNKKGKPLIAKKAVVKKDLPQMQKPALQSPVKKMTPKQIKRHGEYLSGIMEKWDKAISEVKKRFIPDRPKREIKISHSDFKWPWG